MNATTAHTTSDTTQVDVPSTPPEAHQRAARDERPRFRVEAKITGPQVDSNQVEDVALVDTLKDVRARAKEMHRRGLWVEVFSEVSAELLAGPYDPDARMPEVVLTGSPAWPAAAVATFPA